MDGSQFWRGFWRCIHGDFAKPNPQIDAPKTTRLTLGEFHSSWKSALRCGVPIVYHTSLHGELSQKQPQRFGAAEVLLFAQSLVFGVGFGFGYVAREAHAAQRLVCARGAPSKFFFDFLCIVL